MPNRTRFAHMSFFHKFLATIAVLVIASTFVAVAIITRADELQNGFEVEKDSLLTYYLHVKYDGVDVTGTQSSETQVAEVLSDRIKVTDTLPKGLTFVGFVTSDDGTFGAVQRGDTTKACGGSVIDDTHEASLTEGSWNGTEFTYHGLHYDSTTREVSFYVTRLKAGCVLTVGVITRTPATVDDPETTETEYRRDFYNTAFAKEGDITARSNTVHVFMGDLLNESDQHQVTYAYTGDIPAGAPSAPGVQSYYTGATAYVEPNPVMEGYTFNGWNTTDTTVGSDGSYTMPNHDVAFVGIWTAAPAPTQYQVSYRVEGKGETDAERAANLPSWAVPPKQHSYAAGAEVSTDSTEAGAYDGYHFSGWRIMPESATNDTHCSESMESAGTGFVMPAHNVNICGLYERISYTVSYQFEGSVIPPNPETLLPATQSYYPGDVVTRAADPTANGYRFLGWYKGETFVMPENDVVIYGEWGLQTGLFSPTISKEVVNPQGSYKYEDVVDFKITLCNTAAYPIHDVILQELLDSAGFTDGATLSTDGSPLTTELPAPSIIKIDSIPAGSVANPSCAIVYSSIENHEIEAGTITNTVEMIGALADNNNYLDTSKEYKASASYDVEEFDEPDPVTGVVAKNTIVFIGLIVVAVVGGGAIIVSRRK